jgi:hypothetical protein
MRLKSQAIRKEKDPGPNQRRAKDFSKEIESKLEVNYPHLEVLRLCVGF